MAKVEPVVVCPVCELGDFLVVNRYAVHDGELICENPVCIYQRTWDRSHPSENISLKQEENAVNR